MNAQNAPWIWTEMRTSITEGIEKLVAHGSPRQMRDHLVERGIAGLRGSAEQCIVAEYLVQNGYAVRGKVHVDIAGTTASVIDTTGDPGKHIIRSTGLIRHPDTVAELIRGFDSGDYPELVRQ